MEIATKRKKKCMGATLLQSFRQALRYKEVASN